MTVPTGPRDARSVGRSSGRFGTVGSVISIEEFQAEVTNFLKANADEKVDEATFVWGEGSDKVAMFEERDRDSELTSLAKAQAWRAKRYDARLRLHHRARPSTAAVSSRRRTSGPTTPSRPGTTSPTRASSRSAWAWSPRRSWPTARTSRRTPTSRRCTAATSSAASCSPSPAPAATWPACRPGPIRDGDEWVHHRPEGLDVGRPVQRHRRDHRPHRSRPAQAQGPHRLRRRHEGPRRRDPPAAPDDRRGQLQRGLLHRRAGARQPPPRRRQQRLERRPDHADERAGGHRCAVAAGAAAPC